MSRIDDVITTMTNATRVLANGPRSNFRGFQGDRLVARVTRIKPGKVIAQVRGAPCPAPLTPPLSATRAAVAEALHAGADDALPRAA